jgi:hypothetical protein
VTVTVTKTIREKGGGDGEEDIRRWRLKIRLRGSREEEVRRGSGGDSLGFSIGGAKEEISRRSRGGGDLEGHRQPGPTGGGAHHGWLGAGCLL